MRRDCSCAAVRAAFSAIHHAPKMAHAAVMEPGHGFDVLIHDRLVERVRLAAQSSQPVDLESQHVPSQVASAYRQRFPMATSVS